MNSCHIFGPEGRFGVIVLALCRAVAACLGQGRMDAGTIVLVWRRVRRIEARMQALAERVRLGRYRPMERSGSRSGSRSDGPDVGAGPDRVARRMGGNDWQRLPRRFGWLIRLMPSVAAGYASQLSVVMAEPEIVALLRDVPQARRILRPLGRMLMMAWAAQVPRAGRRSDGGGRGAGGGTGRRVDATVDAAVGAGARRDNAADERLEARSGPVAVMRSGAKPRSRPKRDTAGEPRLEVGLGIGGARGGRLFSPG